MSFKSDRIGESSKHRTAWRKACGSQLQAGSIFELARLVTRRINHGNRLLNVQFPISGSPPRVVAAGDKRCGNTTWRLLSQLAESRFDLIGCKLQHFDVGSIQFRQRLETALNDDNFDSAATVESGLHQSLTRLVPIQKNAKDR